MNAMMGTIGILHNLDRKRRAEEGAGRGGSRLSFPSGLNEDQTCCNSSDHQ